MPEYVLTADGSIKCQDGKPVVKGDDGKEFTIDAIGAQKTITTLHAESAEHRKKAAERAKLLEQFGDIDPVKAKEALATVASMSTDHKLEVETLKASLNKTWQEKYDAAEKGAKELSDKLYQATVIKNFATSEVVKKTILTPDIAAKFFGEHFAIDGTAKDAKGNLIYSKTKPGEPAGFDEALDFLIEAYPNKNSIIRGSGADGSGGHHSGGTSSHPAAKFYDKKSPEYNLSEQGRIANTSPDVHNQLKQAFK
jgi:hypothetical protein